VTAKLLMVELVESQGYKRGATVEGLVQWANEPNLLEFVAFGKHKGIRWSEVPRDYLHWALDNMTLDQDLEHTLRHYLGKR
jgi:exodeoxyribonuclease X